MIALDFLIIIVLLRTIRKSKAIIYVNSAQ